MASTRWSKVAIELVVGTAPRTLDMLVTAVPLGYPIWQPSRCIDSCPKDTAVAGDGGSNNGSSGDERPAAAAAQQQRQPAARNG
jgi:hypothetical protein